MKHVYTEAEYSHRSYVVPKWRAIHWLALFCIIPISVIVALRGGTKDTINYLYAFTQTNSFPWNPMEYYSSFSMEWSFGLISWLLNLFSLPPAVLFFIFSFATFYFLSRTSNQVGLNLFQILPYYLGTFFLSQQFLQMRQGLAMAFVFSLVSIINRNRKNIKIILLCLAAAASIHVVSALTVFCIWLLSLVNLQSISKIKFATWCTLSIVITFIFCRLIMSFDVISNFSRLAEYASDEQYSGESALLSLANLRAICFSILIICGASKTLLDSKLFRILSGMYIIHLGIRLGFYDFLILSGRLSTALSFSEIFIIPMLVNEHVRSKWFKFLIALIYLLFHSYATYQIQVPTLINDYFTPL